MNKKGKVYIMGAGPGDAELLTLKGKELLKKLIVLYMIDLSIIIF